MTLHFYKPTSWLGKLVAWFTRGQYSHVGIQFSYRGEYYEAAPFHGVRKLDKPPKGAEIQTISAVNRRPFFGIKFADSQLGKGYDWRGRVAFLTKKTRQSRKDGGKWFCSEFVAVCCEQAGVPLLNADPWLIDPTTLSWSPRLTQT